jgi:steroid 5-alpha reductase family enzyme
MSGLLYVWSIGLGAAVVLMLAAWAVSLWRRDASVVDGFWGAGFVVLTWVYWGLTDGTPGRKLLLATLVTLWGVRLSLHIIRRNWGEDEDYRYRAMREKHGDRFPLVSLFTVFLLQAGLLWLISAPLLQAQAARAEIGALDIAGLAVFVVGIFFETVGDMQLTRFRADPANRGKVLRTGLWRYTRHPNYFGDAAVWWGFFLIGLATPGSAWTVFSPILMTFFLLKVSGVVMLEQKLVETRPEYADYIACTSSFIPWFPSKRTAADAR